MMVLVLSRDERGFEAGTGKRADRLYFCGRHAASGRLPGAAHSRGPVLPTAPVGWARAASAPARASRPSARVRPAWLRPAPARRSRVWAERDRLVPERHLFRARCGRIPRSPCFADASMCGAGPALPSSHLRPSTNRSNAIIARIRSRTPRGAARTPPPVRASSATRCSPASRPTSPGASPSIGRAPRRAMPTRTTATSNRGYAWERRDRAERFSGFDAARCTGPRADA